MVMLSLAVHTQISEIPFQSESSLVKAMTTRHTNTTSTDLFSLSEEFLFLNRFTRSIIYAGVISVDMSPLELDYTKKNLTNPSKTFLWQNFLGELKQLFRHIHWLHGLWKTSTTAWQENKLDILGFLAKILGYKYKNCASFNWGISTKIHLITAYCFSNVHRFITIK